MAAAARAARATRKKKPDDDEVTPRKAKAAAASTPTRSASGRAKTSKAKTSPYFNKAARGKRKAESEDSAAEPTGLTSDDEDETTDSGAGSAFDPDSDDEADDDADAMNGDDSEEEATPKPKGGAKRKAPASSAADKAQAKWGRGAKGRKSAAEPVELGSDDDIELEEGQEIAGRIYPAPTTGQVPPGQVSRNTLHFLSLLQVPENNDRDWFRAHEPAYRQAEAEWKAFMLPLQARIGEADDEVPVLPPNDVIHRIYRDVRFSSDKTPYKSNFSMSTSRGGKKGTWAGYHLSICPRGHSILACGKWQPSRDDIAAIRANILLDPAPFRAAIGAPAFTKLFGKAEPGKKGKAQNVFGHHDELKVAPKGVDKTHKDIDLLKLRSVVVFHHFTDDEVTASDFIDKVGAVVEVMAPFVHMLNSYMAAPVDDDSD
ncbi:hypothetical protein Q8F55_003877 [Vanrija albida]|uniref:DUF2461 domain-containing protein n=1 Tax=Vanrija albida TaxID=181172 RepID=A0ABR3Q683_9TREE